MRNFITALGVISRPAGGGAHAFMNAEGDCLGYVQLIWQSDREMMIHRLWTLRPGAGRGSEMLRAVCDHADRYGIEINLKALPFGRKPYPLSREQLVNWYQRHGFEGTRRKMTRMPKLAAPLAVASSM